ncbi:hypothetical protein BDN72DRAFT_781471 [Pluteus cervinus]|uniref:Uncharacterized protein n=1 Tax=Pluteus cervinus TaxID=181527 RepID=A0ACD3A1W4_9AGAR|nr:hypothetical protein BDN72DRAFT_781471 [Pluteus cervinus]
MVRPSFPFLCCIELEFDALNHFSARVCDAEGKDIPLGSKPPPRTEASNDDWGSYDDDLQFHVADFLYRQDEMSQPNMNYLLHLWALSLMKYGALGPFANYQHLFDTIDATSVGDVPWKCLMVEPDRDGVPPDSLPSWKRQDYEVWYRDPDVVIKNMLDNPDFDGEFDYHPYVHLNRDGKREWCDYMSANFAWTQCGAMYVPVILGSDKTTVSVGTGDTEYHPLYMSIGNVRNGVRRAHRNAIIPIGFLAIPKSDRKYDNDPEFRRFKKQLYHSTIAAILSSLKPGMTKPVVRRCPDGHFRRVIYDLGAYIADYPEQVVLAGIVSGWCPKCTAQLGDTDSQGVPRSHDHSDGLRKHFDPDILWDEWGIDDGVIPFTRDFPRADIHELLSSDLLHQVIKGTFKDHLVTWVEEYLQLTHEKSVAAKMMDELDRRLAATPTFPGLRRFKQGRRFKQWTGDDSKALMKVRGLLVL